MCDQGKDLVTIGDTCFLSCELKELREFEFHKIIYLHMIFHNNVTYKVILHEFSFLHELL
jgi:hypothetical protein